MPAPDYESQEPQRRNFVGQGNEAFTCLVCGCPVLPLVNGSFRNHCPECLWSRHVDKQPGDREETCGGLMRPSGLEGSPASGFQVVHVCTQCGAERRNKSAEDDGRQPDVWERLVELSALGGGR